MKKLILMLFAALCVVFSAYAASAQETFVRVGLKYGNSAVSSASFSGEQGLNFFNAVTGEKLYTSAAGEAVEVVQSGAGFASAGKFSAGNVTKLSVQSTNKTPISYGPAAYRGYFFLERSSGGITVINIVAMSHYLYSVLGKEMSPSFPSEALKAQAICAKNFVLGEKQRHAAYGFDVCATTHCQVYSGVSGESAATIAAVDAVAGKAAYYKGEIVPLYFFATSGGKTADCAEVWGMDLPYLVSVDDPFEPADKASRYRWSVTLTGAEIGSRLADRGYDIGTVTSITADEVSPSGRVARLTLTGTKGSKTLEREACRTVIGSDKIYSRRFTVSGDGEAGGVMTTAGALAGGQVLTAEGVRPMAGKSILSADGLSLFSAGTAKGSTFTFSGSGYGHGVGMSQWGAYGMAQQGYKYDEILKHYFAGIEIK